MLDRNGDSTTVEYLNGAGIDDKLRQRSSSAPTTPHYFLTDHLGSTTALTDASGAVVERQSYEAFGASAGSSLTRYGYTGRERDGETGLLYYRARWYDAQQGRFLSEDPIGFASGDTNLYSYVSNNPLSFTDPSGNVAFLIIGFAIAAGIAILLSPSVANAPGPGDKTYPCENTLALTVIENTGGEFLVKRAVVPLIKKAAGPIIRRLGKSGEEYFFRGTSEGFEGSPSVQQAGVTPTSTDPSVATVFATESANYGRGVVHIASSSDLAGVKIGSANVLRELEKEVVFDILPSEFAKRAGVTITSEQARTILRQMGVQLPGSIVTRAKLTDVLHTLTHLSSSQISEFVKRAKSL